MLFSIYSLFFIAENQKSKAEKNCWIFI